MRSHALGMLLAALLIVGGCASVNQGRGPGSPAAVVEEFVRLAYQGKVEGAYELTSERWKVRMSEESFSLLVGVFDAETMGERLNEQNRGALAGTIEVQVARIALEEVVRAIDYRVENQVIEGDRATVELKVTAPDMSEAPNLVKLEIMGVYMQALEEKCDLKTYRANLRTLLEALPKKAEVRRIDLLRENGRWRLNAELNSDFLDPSGMVPESGGE